jgi:hypothetical protein
MKILKNIICLIWGHKWDIHNGCSRCESVFTEYTHRFWLGLDIRAVIKKLFSKKDKMPF